MAAARARRAPPQYARAEPRPVPPRPPRGRSYAQHRQAPRLGERSPPPSFLPPCFARGRWAGEGGEGRRRWQPCCCESLCLTLGTSVVRRRRGRRRRRWGGGEGGRRRKKTSPPPEAEGEDGRPRASPPVPNGRCPPAEAARPQQPCKSARARSVSSVGAAGRGPAPGLCVAASTGAGLGAGRGRAWAGVGGGLRPGPRSHNAGGGEPEGGVRRRGRGVQLAAFFFPRFLPAPCAPAGLAGAASPASSDRSRLLSSLSPWGPAVWKQHGGAGETRALEVGEAERSGFMKNECIGGRWRGWVARVGEGGGGVSSRPASVQENLDRRLRM